MQKRYCIGKNSFLEVFSPMSRLMTRHKTPGSEQVDPPVDSILGNLSELTHSLFASNHAFSLFEPCSLGSEQVDPPVDSILGIPDWVESPVPCVDSFPIFLSIISSRVRTGRLLGRSTLGESLFELTHSLFESTHNLFCKIFTLLIWEGNFLGWTVILHHWS